MLKSVVLSALFVFCIIQNSVAFDRQARIAELEWLIESISPDIKRTPNITMDSTAEDIEAETVNYHNKFKEWVSFNIELIELKTDDPEKQRRMKQSIADAVIKEAAAFDRTMSYAATLRQPPSKRKW